jgi:tetratricopeptide (TPR) repeat protein
VKAGPRIGTLIFILLLAFATWSFSQQPTDQVQQLYEQAKLEEKSGRPDEAIRKYEQIIKLDPKLAAAYNNLGRLYYQQDRYARPASSNRNWSLHGRCWDLSCSNARTTKEPDEN